MSGFLHEAQPSERAQRLYDEDLADEGYIMNHTRLWAHQPELVEDLFALMGKTTEGHFSFRQRAIMVTAAASAFDNAGCSLAWGRRLASVSSDEIAGDVIAGDDAGLDATERPLAEWARALARNPSRTTSEQVEALRQAGFSEADILAATMYIALRVAFSTVNDGLGAPADVQLVARAPEAVREKVTFGRRPDAT